MGTDVLHCTLFVRDFFFLSYLGCLNEMFDTKYSPVRYRVVQHSEQIITLTKLFDAHENIASTRRQNLEINIYGFYAGHASSGEFES